MSITPSITSVVDARTTSIEGEIDVMVEDMISKLQSAEYLVEGASRRGVKKLIKTRLIQHVSVTRKNRGFSAYIKGREDGERQAVRDKQDQGQPVYRTNEIPANELEALVDQLKGRENAEDFRDLTEGIIDHLDRTKYLKKELTTKEKFGIKQTISRRYIKWFNDSMQPFIADVYHEGWVAAYRAAFQVQ